MAAIEGGFDLSMLLTGEDPFKGLKDDDLALRDAENGEYLLAL